MHCKLHCIVPVLSVAVTLVPPSAPSVSRVSDTAVMVQWSVAENEGLPISLFRVQYKEVKPDTGQWQTVDDDISAKARRYKVSRLKAGGCHKNLEPNQNTQRLKRTLFNQD